MSQKTVRIRSSPAGNATDITIKPVKRTSKKKRAPSSQNYSQKMVPVSRATTLRLEAGRIQRLPNGDGRIRVAHREFVCSLSPANGVIWSMMHSVALQPGLHLSFPWLSGIARQYESYEFRALQFEFVSALGTASAGRISMAVDYDASDRPPGSQSDMMSYNGAVSANVHQSVTLNCPVANLSKFGTQRYVRAAALSPNSDIKTYDVGNMFVACSGNATAALGELYVSYVVDLMTPQIITNADLALAQTSQCNTSPAQQPVPNKIFGTSLLSKTGQLPLDYDGTTGFFNLMEAGEYLVTTLLAGTGVTESAGIRDYDPAKVGVLAQVMAPVINAAATLASYAFVLRVIAGPVTFRIGTSAGGLPTTVTGAQMTISPYAVAA